MDNCLLCRACETVCPAQVPYAKILDDFRNEAGEGRKPALVKMQSTLSRSFLFNKKLSGITATVATFSRSSKLLSAISNRFPAVQRLHSFLTDLKPRHNREFFYPTQFPKRGRAGLFTGCTGELFDAGTIDAAIRILDRLGFDVMIVPNQNCCGALDLHSGNATRAATLAAGNLQAFGRSDIDVIVPLATGCGAMLSEYSAYFPDSERFSSKIVEVCQLIHQSEGFTSIPLNPLDAKLLIHTPCSLANVLKTAQAPQKLVQAIPNTRVSTFKETRCCGAAGNYMLEHPEMADALRDDLLETVKKENPDYLLTTNIGCALHLRAGLRQQQIDTEVLHPIELIDRQMRATGIA